MTYIKLFPAAVLSSKLFNLLFQRLASLIFHIFFSKYNNKIDEGTTASVTQEYSSYLKKYLRKLYPCVLNAIVQIYNNHNIHNFFHGWFLLKRDDNLKETGGTLQFCILTISPKNSIAVKQATTHTQSMHAIHTTRSTTKKQKNEGPLGLLYVPSRVGIEKKTSCHNFNNLLEFISAWFFGTAS